MDDENGHNTVNTNTTRPSLLFSNTTEMLRGHTCSTRNSVSNDDVESTTLSTHKLDRSLSSSGNTASESFILNGLTADSIMFEDEAVCYRGNESETSSTLSPSSVESDASVASSGSSLSVSSLPRRRLDSVSDTPKILKLMYTNIDTFLNKREELLTRLSADNPDILGIVELLPKKRIEFNSCEYKLPIYTLFMGLNPKQGVAIYIRDKFKAQAHYFLHNDFEEAIWCVVHLDRGEKLLVGVMYRSPYSSGNNNDSLLKLFEDVADSSYSHILIMEDFNYKDIDWVSNTSRLGANSDTSRFVWYQHIQQNTRFRQGDLLDLLVTNDEEMIQNLMYDSPIGKSDHVVIKFLCNCFGEVKNRKASFRYYSGDYLGLTNYLDNSSQMTKEGKNGNFFFNVFRKQ